MADGESEELSLTTRRRRGSMHLNRCCICFCIIASRITLEFNEEVSVRLEPNGPS
jgi:hypothetical protein